MSDLHEYFNAVYGDAVGRAHIAIGGGPHLTAAGKYSHKRWSEHHFAWPEEAGLVEREILRAAYESDVYACPYVDNGVLDLDKVRALHGFAVASGGTTGNGHAYVALAESVPQHWHRKLCRALGVYLGAVDHKIADNDLLRPPGTFNHKPTTAGGDPALVEWIVRP